MQVIIAGRFIEQKAAQDAVEALIAAGFAEGRVASFFVNPPGQHDLSGTKGDPGASAGAHRAGAGAAKGSLAGAGVGTVVGLATLPVLGPAAAAAGAAVGAYVGSLHGAIESLGDPKQLVGSDRNVPKEVREEAAPRRSGMFVAVSTPTAEYEATAIQVMRAQGAEDVERAHGDIASGRWDDFDPLGAPALVD